MLTDPRNDKPFYIGYGQKNRMYQHEKDVLADKIPNRTNIKLGNKIKKILDSGKMIEYKKIFITENRQEALNREKELIEEKGLENLCNLTSGGEGGYIVSEETKQKLSTLKKGKTKRKISENSTKYWLGKTRSKETRKKLSEAHKGQIPWNKGKTGVYSETTIKKISKTLTGRKLSAEHKRKISESYKKRKLEVALL